MISSDVKQAIDSASNYPHILRIGVFGSYARNEESTASDLDILLDYDDSSDNFIDDLGSFMEDMEHQVKTEIGYVTMEGLRNSTNETVKRDILNDVQWIYISNIKQKNQ